MPLPSLDMDVFCRHRCKTFLLFRCSGNSVAVVSGAELETGLLADFDLEAEVAALALSTVDLLPPLL